MTIRDAVEIIKAQVSARDVVGLYGYHPNSGGYICCPFHGERTPSLKLHKSGWYCYGCHTGGSVVDFVMRHEDCSFLTAVKALDSHFRFGLLDNGRRSLLGLMDDRKARQKFDQDKAELLLSVEELIEDCEDKLKGWLTVYVDSFATPKPQRTAKQWFDLENAREWCQHYEMQINDLRESIQEMKAWKMLPSKAHSV